MAVEHSVLSGHSSTMQVGLDDLLHPWFQQSSIKAGEACLQEAAIPQCRAALQKGAAPALRPGLWATALALDLEYEPLGEEFEGLCSQVEECNLLTDLLVSVHAWLQLSAVPAAWTGTLSPQSARTSCISCYACETPCHTYLSDQ